MHAHNKQTAPGSTLLAQAKAVNGTDDAKHKTTLLKLAKEKSDHGGRLVASAKRVLQRAEQHRQNAASIREQAQRTSDAAKATMQLGRRFAREAVSHRLKTMTYRSKCTMMRAQAEAALRRAKDEAENAKDLKKIAKPDDAKPDDSSSGKQVSPDGAGTTLLQTMALSSGVFSSTMSPDKGGENQYLEMRKAKENHMQTMEENLNNALRKTEQDKENEQNEISSLKVAIARDRKDYQAAREQVHDAQEKERFAREETKTVGQLRQKAAIRKEALAAQKAVSVERVHSFCVCMRLCVCACGVPVSVCLAG
jgi:hypothetical protein